MPSLSEVDAASSSGSAAWLYEDDDTTAAEHCFSPDTSPSKYVQALDYQVAAAELSRDLYILCMLQMEAGWQQQAHCPVSGLLRRLSAPGLCARLSWRDWLHLGTQLCPGISAGPVHHQ